MTNHQLKKWLMKEVHGIDLPRRKPVRKSLSYCESRGIARNWKYKAWIRSFPCAACGSDPAGEAAHTGDHGLGQKSSDYQTIPLCTDCHTMAPCAYHRLGREAFEKHHGLDIEDLVRRLNRLWFHPLKRSNRGE